MVTVDETYLPVTLTAPGLSDEEFEVLCDRYEHYRIEYTGDGDLVVMPPTDPETSYHNSRIVHQLTDWAIFHGRGAVTESSGGFHLPNGARYAPDAAWTSRERLRQRRPCPEFVIELLSPSDRPAKVRAKMREWIENGAELAWMIHRADRSVTIFRRDREPEVRVGILELAGEGPVEGFLLDLRPIWQPV